MGGMVVGEQTMRAYGETKAQTPKAIADLNAVIAKASALGGALASYNMTLTVPQAIKVPEAASASRPK
jgi:hypothetical protein